MTFVKGVSGNPSGRPKIAGDVIALARKHTVAAIETLQEVMLDKDAPHAARVVAADKLLDRAHGKPSQDITLAGDDKRPLYVMRLPDAPGTFVGWAERVGAVDTEEQG